MRPALLLLLATLTAAPAQSLGVRARTSTPPEMGTLHFLELSRDSHTYTLVPPGSDWRLKLDAPELGEARVLGELDVFNGDAAGRAADFAYALLGHPRRCRVAAVPVPGGTVDFALHCSVEEFSAAQQALGARLNTFQRTSRTAAEQKLAQLESKISGD